MAFLWEARMRPEKHMVSTWLVPLCTDTKWDFILFNLSLLLHCSPSELPGLSSDGHYLKWTFLMKHEKDTPRRINSIHSPSLGFHLQSSTWKTNSNSDKVAFFSAPQTPHSWVAQKSQCWDCLLLPVPQKPEAHSLIVNVFLYSWQISPF